jgi:hypothetical protein
MPSTYKATANEYYNKIYEYLSNHPDIVRNLDVNNVKEIINISMKLLKEVGHSGDPKCYTVAAGISAILTHRNIKHQVLAGLAGSGHLIDAMKDKTVVGSNHVWVDTENNRYEYFEGQSNDMCHYTITEDVIFKKGK